MKHFTLNELTRSATAASHGIDNTPPEWAVKNLELLVEKLLDPIREMWGAPIYVNSGYRCKQLNQAVGGAPNSRHMKGLAADITTHDRRLNIALYQLIAHFFGRSQEHPQIYHELINEHDGQWIHISY